eukprot:6175833-Prymnesium_polylepis.1
MAGARRAQDERHQDLPDGRDAVSPRQGAVRPAHASARPLRGRRHVRHAAIQRRDAAPRKGGHVRWGPRRAHAAAGQGNQHDAAASVCSLRVGGRHARTRPCRDRIGRCVQTARASGAASLPPLQSPRRWALARPRAQHRAVEIRPHPTMAGVPVGHVLCRGADPLGLVGAALDALRQLDANRQEDHHRGAPPAGPSPSSSTLTRRPLTPSNPSHPPTPHTLQPSHPHNLKPHPRPSPQPDAPPPCSPPTDRAIKVRS